MLEQRDLRADLLALALLALTVFLAASALSYDSADPPARLVFPERTETANVCGRFGASISGSMFVAFGLGTYYLLFSLAVFNSLLLMRRTIGDPVLRVAGWLLSLTGFSTLAAMAVPDWSPGPVIGSGGYLGAAVAGMLEMNFASVGAYILTVSLILGGLLLCTDYVVIRVIAWTVGFPAKNLGRGVLLVGSAYAGKLGTKRSDVDILYEEDEDEEEEEEKEEKKNISVRIRGRPVDEDVEDEGDEEDGEEQEDGDKSQLAAKQPSASPLRVRKPRKSQREEVMEQIEAASNRNGAEDYALPSLDLLLENDPFCFEEHEKEVRRKAKILEKTFADFGFNIRVVEIQTGPVIAQFEVELEAGLRLSRITGLADDLAIALRVPSVRIVAPIPGKNTVGVEVPNVQRQLVRLREVMEEIGGKAQKMRIPLYLGKDVAGNPMVADLTTLPHLLIAGRTGTGKSVCLNSIIASILMTRRPDEVRMLMIDPKMVELSPYKRLPHLMHPVVTDMRKAEAILAWAVEKMEERYQILARAGVRHVGVYNQLGEEELRERVAPESDEQWSHFPTHMPYIVIVADELADLMMTAAKEVEGHIIRLAQKSRAVGIHLVLATQKPTVDVITGLIKSNLPARIAFQVASRTDSRVVLDEMGADRLLGDGDMLFLWPGTSTLIRGQGTFLSDDEIAQVIGAVATSEPQFVTELVQLKAGEPEPEGRQLDNRDELYEAAIDVVVREARGSVSLLQRNLGIGYGRAARLIDYMAEDGIVGPYNGSQAREVLISLEDWQAGSVRPLGESSASVPSSGSSKILFSPPDATDDEVPVGPDRVADDLKAEQLDEESEEDGAYDEDELDAEEELDEDEEEEYEEEDSEEYEEYDDDVDADEEEDEEDIEPWTAESA